MPPRNSIVTKNINNNFHKMIDGYFGRRLVIFVIFVYNNI